jgi:class 3 adenylate cyclase
LRAVDAEVFGLDVDDLSLGLLERHHALVCEALVRYGGMERDTAGDGFFATFDGPARAIRCAQELAEHVRDRGLEF